MFFPPPQRPADDPPAPGLPEQAVGPSAEPPPPTKLANGYWVSALATAVLFLTTAAATGFQVFRTIMWGVWGRPTDPVECVAFLGAAVLFFGGLLSLISLDVGGPVACAGVVAVWACYGPALVNLLGNKLPEDLPPADALILFGPPLLLFASTLVILIGLVRQIRSVVRSWRG